jgi:hypothetical protein
MLVQMHHSLLHVLLVETVAAAQITLVETVVLARRVLHVPVVAVRVVGV